MTDNILLRGDKGGGGGSFKEDDNSLKSVTWVKTLEALGYGTQLGPVKGLQSVYLDDTPLYDGDNNPNFQDVSVEFRYGTPSQTVIKGFEEVGAITSVATTVTTAAPVSRTVSSASVSSVSVTIRLPNGLYNQNTNDNKLEKTTLNFRIQTKLTSSGTWTTALDKTYTDKVTGPYEESFRIDRPSGTGTWDIRVVRVTADSVSSTLRNDLVFNYFNEYENEVLTYNNVALMAIQLNAAGVNSSRVPTRSIDWLGRIVRVPNNFNTRTRVFTGVWNLSTFKNDWCNDPAWVLFDIATDATVGLGLSDSQIDLASFYEASIYNSTQVSYTGFSGATSTEPRYSFNSQITTAFSPIELMKQVASVMNASVLWVNGKLTVVQDRPDTYSYVFTNANVVDGIFKRASTPVDTRYTVCNVTWNSPGDGFKQRVSSVEDAAGIARYGYIETSVAAFGATSLPQAIRYGKWILDTSLNSTNTVTFTVGEVGALVIPGDVIRVYDNVYAQVDGAGRLLSGSTTSVLNLDRTVTLSAGSTITLWNSDGSVLSDLAVTTTGTVSSLTLTTPLASAPSEGVIYQVTTSAIEPETYRVISRTERSEPGTFDIVAGTYDPNKWARVEGGVALQTYKNTKKASQLPSAVTSLTFNERTIYIDLAVKRTLYITWAPTAGDIIKGYKVVYTLNGGSSTTVETKTPSIELDVYPGVLDIKVQAIGFSGLLSQPSGGSYTVAATETTGSVLNPVTNLVVLNTAGVTFTTGDLNIQWTNPTTNGSTQNAVARFKVEVYNGASLLRTEYIGAVGPGQVQTYAYPLSKNIADGGPRRTITVKVYAQEANLKLSSATTAVFTNAAPAAPSSPAITGGIGQMFVSFTRPTDNDYLGTIVWASTTNGFVPASGNVVYDGSDNNISFKALSSATHYIKVAHYDTFGKDYAGTGLNLSAQLSATPLASAGIPSGSALPGSGSEGDLFFNTADGKLYRYHSGAWTTAVPTSDLSGTISATQLGAIIGGGNMLTNSSFEVDSNGDGLPDGWSQYNSGVSTGATWSPNGSGAPYGAFAMALQATSLGTTTADRVGVWQDVNVTNLIGQKFVVSAWMKGITAVAHGHIYIDYLNGATYVSTGVEADVTLNTSTYQRVVSAIQTVPAGVTTARIYFMVQQRATSAGAAGMLLDGVQVEFGEVATAYAPNPSEILAGTITTTAIADNAITTPKLVAGSVVAGKIAANAVSTNELAANAVTTNKLFVTGQGQNLNADPQMTDLTAWAGSATPLLLSGITDLPVGGSTAVTNTPNAQTMVVSTDYIPIDSSFNYRLEATLKQTSGTLGNGYIGVLWYDGNKSQLTASGATGWGGSGTGSYFGLVGAVVPTTWTSYSIGFGPDETAKQHPSAKFVRLLVFLNYNSTVGSVCALGHYGMLRKTKGEVIVDGTLAASKLVANSITAGQIAAATITSTQIAANTITASNIAANTITASKIAAGTITGTEIAAATITGAKIAAGTIAASNITVGTITTDRIQVGSVVTSSSAYNGTVLLYSGAATSGAGGNLQGPTLTTTGRNVEVSFTGVCSFGVNNTASFIYNTNVRLFLYNTTTGVYYGVVPGEYIGQSWSDFSAMSGQTTFGRGLCVTGLIVAPPAGTYRLDANIEGSAFSLTSSSGVNVITSIVGGGDFSIKELKV